MSEHIRPTSQQGTPRRTASSARPASTSRPAAGTRTGTAPRTASGTRSAGGTKTSSTVRTGNASRTGALHTTLKKPAPKRKPARKQLFGYDLETIIALALIVVVAVGIVTLAVVGIKHYSDRHTTKVPLEVANIYAEQTQTPLDPQQNPAVQTSDGQNATGEQPVVSQTPTPAQTSSNVVLPGGKTLRSATIRTVGDFVIDTKLLASAKNDATRNGSEYPYDFSSMLSMISDTMKNADFTVANVDGSMGGKSHYKYGYSGYPQFNTPEYLLFNLVDSGVDMLTLANNHMLDGWFDGLMDEIKNVELVGLKYVGANKSKEDKESPHIVEINGIKVGMMNYTVDLNSMDQQKSLDKRALEFGVNAVKNSNAPADAKRLRDAGADVIVCFMHWGTEYTSSPSNDQKNLAQKLVKAGVDVIMGGHPHVVQPAEWLSGTNQFGEMQRTLCIYSVGNYLSEHGIVKNKNTGESCYCNGGVIFDFTIQERGDGTFEITAPSYLPVYVWANGDDIRGYSYRLLPAGKYISQNSRPSGMSENDFSAMRLSYQYQLNVMSRGVGTEIFN